MLNVMHKFKESGCGMNMLQLMKGIIQTRSISCVDIDLMFPMSCCTIKITKPAADAPHKSKSRQN